MTPFILKILLQFCVTLNEPGRLISISGAFQKKGFTGRQNLLCHSDAFAQRFVLWEQPLRQLDLVVSVSSRKGGELLQEEVCQTDMCGKVQHTVDMVW